jgi:hypothetical protein
MVASTTQASEAMVSLVECNVTRTIAASARRMQRFVSGQKGGHTGRPSFSVRVPTISRIGMSVPLDTSKTRMIHVNDNLPDKIFSGHLGTLGRGD